MEAPRQAANAEYAMLRNALANCDSKSWNVVWRIRFGNKKEYVLVLRLETGLLE
jgi:hypothetical protein